MIANVLTIAGVDPSGGAGIAADLKTFSALGAFGMVVVTAVTAQNTRGVAAVHQLGPGLVTEQLETLLTDVRVDAVKSGCWAPRRSSGRSPTPSAGTELPHVVLDPVMVATSGDRLLAADAVTALRDDLLPLADLITPNLPEAADLLGVPPARDEQDMLPQLRQLASSARRVLLKGGHLDGPDSVDLLAMRRPGRPAGGCPGGHIQHPRHRLHVVIGDRRAASPIARLGGRRSAAPRTTSPPPSPPPTSWTSAPVTAQSTTSTRSGPDALRALSPSKGLRRAQGNSAACSEC